MRCNLIGMEPERIQYNRDPLGSKAERMALSAYSPGEQSTSSSSDDQTELRLINRLVENYKILEQRRDQLYERRQSGKPRGRALNFKEVNRSCMDECVLRAHWIAATFPIFKSFSFNEKKIMFANFFAGNTILYLGKMCCLYGRTDRIIFSNTGNYLDMQNIQDFYREEDDENPSKEATRLFAPSFELYRRNILEPMVKLRFDETEFAVLSALTLWESGQSGQGPECENTCHKMQKEIIRELIIYYNTVACVPEPEQRLYQLLIMLPALQRCVIRTIEDWRVGKIFKICETDFSFFETILRNL
ncbi:hypothetical protein WR25_02207 isoform I [Diploscapter pachys]|nr:hypothetical protein WR25_02207 isoform B [Diploscapter pachys]PAV58288.1 hypothetical protein WR25_02207 isoform D [Diploscapter pachys]PAV58289.1 hypothetical protein WR25_02207 isoform E [Diploscapter pachys]PAV58293.1 hypothetical protein WR25_02207 isoform I [Diploscapter pachys]